MVKDLLKHKFGDWTNSPLFDFCIRLMALRTIFGELSNSCRDVLVQVEVLKHVAAQHSKDETTLEKASQLRHDMAAQLVSDRSHVGSSLFGSDLQPSCCMQLGLCSHGFQRADVGR